MNNVKSTGHTEGRKLNIAGGDYRVLISGADTSGAYAMIEMTVPAGAGPIPHAHPDFEEIFYVVDGELTFRTEGGTLLAQKGATIRIPKGGAIHNFKNNAATPAKLLCTVMPAGLDQFFIEVEELMTANSDKQADIKNDISLLSEKYGQILYSPDYWDL